MRTSAIAAACVAASLACGSALAAPVHPCAADALAHASRLLALQADDATAPTDVSKTVKPMPALRNPSDAKQKLDVLAVDGYIMKTTYRMRFLYAQVPGQCALMGQEILELSSY